MHKGRTNVRETVSMQYLSPQVRSAPRSNEAPQGHTFAQETVCSLRGFLVAPRTPLYLPKASPRGASRLCIAIQYYSDSVQTTREGPALSRYFYLPSYYMSDGLENSSSAEMTALCRRSLFPDVPLAGSS